jgi:hypothetical protein
MARIMAADHNIRSTISMCWRMRFLRVASPVSRQACWLDLDGCDDGHCRWHGDCPLVLSAHPRYRAVLLDMTAIRIAEDPLDPGDRWRPRHRPVSGAAQPLQRRIW